VFGNEKHGSRQSGADKGEIMTPHEILRIAAELNWNTEPEVLKHNTLQFVWWLAEQKKKQAPKELSVVRPPELLISMKSPDASLYANFLSPQECMTLISLGANHLQRSKVVDSKTGAPVQSDKRTSSSASLSRHAPFVAAIDKRISDLTGFPIENGEYLQVLRYDVGQEYQPHFDYFNVAREQINSVLIKNGGQRVATFLMYLNTPVGGETIFPNAGLSIPARAGNALLFKYPTPTPETKTLHGGSPVRGGVKWIATKWFREQKWSPK
jgi:prolyl 4-hydroxylase